MFINPSHPRAVSLRIRERLVWGVKKGLTSTAGLLAHGRGEAFDYLLSETTQKFAREAIKAASAYFILSSQPILSINGNTAALCAKDFIQLARILNCKIEVNLFHYSQKRVKLIENYLKKSAKESVLTSKNNSQMAIPNIGSARGKVLKEGIGRSDLVFVPLEDGDRTKALVAAGKKVVTVDLNPLSRTAQTANVTIVDNITRCMPHILKTVEFFKKLPKDKLVEIIKNYNNETVLSQAINFINSHLYAAAENLERKKFV